MAKFEWRIADGSWLMAFGEGPIKNGECLIAFLIKANFIFHFLSVAAVLLTSLCAGFDTSAAYTRFSEHRWAGGIRGEIRYI
jgi:hypothetical protein